MIAKLIIKAGFKLLIPLFGVIGLTIFFGLFLTPSQRDILIKRMLSAIPGVRHFVSTQHKTNLNVQANERANELKAAYQSFDYLISIRNNQGQEYIAIYPFTVEAGYKLDQLIVVKTVNSEKNKIEITLPPAVILNVDEEKDATILRDTLEGDRDLILKPVKIAFEKAARDRAIRMNVLEDADKKAEEYYRNLWKGVYDEVVVNTTKADVPHFNEYALPHLPVRFEVSKEGFTYEFKPSDGYRRIDAHFATKGNPIDLGYSREFSGLYKDLYESVASSLAEGNSYVIKIVDTDDPLKKATVCEYDSKHGTCYVSLGQKLFFINHAGETEEQFKQSFGDVFYLSYSAKPGTHEDSTYYRYIDLLKTVNSAVNEKNFATLFDVSKFINEMGNPSKESKQLYSIATVLQNASFAATGDDALDIDISLLSSVKAGNFGNVDQAALTKAHANFMKDKQLYNAFLAFLLSNNELQFDEAIRKQYLSRILQDGYLSPELFDVIDDAELKYALNVKLSNKIKDVIEYQKKEIGHSVFCHGTSTDPRYDCPDSFIYYDKYALDTLYKEGADIARTKISGPEFNIDDHLIVVVSRGIFITDYDAFVFGKEGIWLFKDFIDERLPIFYKYNELDMGGRGNEVTLDGQKYQNYTLTAFLSELSTIMKKRSNGGSSKIFCDLLTRQLSEKAMLLSSIPQPR